jgi:hypothetical protein
MDDKNVMEEELSSMNRMFILLAEKYDTNSLWNILDAQTVIAYLPSDQLGIMTTISDYTWSDGTIVKAHFTQKGRFYRRVHENEGPISYYCNIMVTREAFEIDYHALSFIVENLNLYPTKGICKEELSWLFNPKRLEDIPFNLRVEY